MAKVSTYLNFVGKTEEAFHFYKSVFGTEFEAPIQYMREIPADPAFPPRSTAEEGMVMHVALPILGGHRLLGTDLLESMGHKLELGNNVALNLEPDTRAETEQLFNRLAKGGIIEMPLTEMFWGGYFGSLQDKYGIRWMLNCASAT
jgi:PhnB protein